jgi:predicted transcriptional regulator
MIIKTGSIAEAAKEFIDVWHRTEKKHASQPTVEKISFKDQRLLFKTLTPKRFEILEYVHQQNGISIRMLAKHLDRDYSNVHQDVKILYQLGLMTKDEQTGKFYVPWDVIVTEITLPIIKKSKITKRTHSHHKSRTANG